jgi:hypothetical protein
LNDLQIRERKNEEKEIKKKRNEKVRRKNWQ